jgi:serine phosphatase RsbU (regulator of sigma subunit)
MEATARAPQRRMTTTPERTALASLLAEALRLADGVTIDDALAAIASSAAATAGADVAVVRVREPGARTVVARACAAASSALATEVEGTRLALDEIAERDALEELPPAIGRLAELAEATAVLQLPVHFGGRTLGSLELLRRGEPFDEGERLLARVAASQAALSIAALDPGLPGREGSAALFLAGEALAAALADGSAAEAVARLALEAAGATESRLWRQDADDLVLAAAPEPIDPDERAKAAAAEALAEREPVRVLEDARGAVVSLQLGRPPSGLLELRFAAGHEPDAAHLRALAAFAARAAETLRAGERSRRLADELERTRALLAVVGQAIAQLSLRHTLETAAEQVARLLRVERVAVYLDEGAGLAVAAERKLAGPHAAVAGRLLELALGRYRARGKVSIENARDEPLLASVRVSVQEAGIEAAHAVPLLAHDEVIGLLAAYPRRGRSLGEAESELLAALAGQLAVAVQNARLHEQAKQLGAELEESLRETRLAARRLGAQSAVSGSFAESMSLETTLDALARTVIELLGVDAAVIRMPDARGDALVAQSIHVADPAKADAVRAIFSRPEAASRTAAERALTGGEPIVLDARSAEVFGGAHALLSPFLEAGGSAVVVPIASSERSVQATITLLSLDPERPIGDETIDIATEVVQQAGFAIENARLYRQLEQFTRSMQDSLLPRGTVEVEGLEVGAVYESSARLEVGGDLYDYLVLEDGRLAVVLGDVTGHGVDAAADMAMAKFVFRSLVRRYRDPGELLARVNDVICDEVGPGKFVTMLSLTYDPETAELACASAGHPAPRLVDPAGGVESLDVHGLALGIETGQQYEVARRRLEPGAVAVLFTDGVIEARRDGELYGEQRLDVFLARRAELPAQELARAVVADCRRHAGGELSDDCAVVVLERREAAVPVLRRAARAGPDGDHE